MSEREALLEAGGGYGALDPASEITQCSPAEFYSLSESVAGGVSALTGAARSLQRLRRQVGTAADTPALRDNIRDTQQSVNARASSTAQALARLSELARRGDKQQKLQAERLTHAFSDALNTYSSLQHALRDLLAARPAPARARAPAAAAVAAEQDEQLASLSAQQAHQTRLVEFETSLLLEREEYVSRLEADVIDVNQIMSQLAGLVHSQGLTVDTVESQMESAQAHVAEGTEELVKAAGHQRRYRRKLLVLLACAVLAAIVLVAVLLRQLL